ncbi:MAG: UvrD-helicase domain-containing protein [Verrucomicrobiota bacterium]
MTISSATSLKESLEEAALLGLSNLVSAEWSNYELDASFKDLLSLSRGGDAMYDRQSTGWAYAIWYHARRVQTAYRLIAHEVRTGDEPLTFVDFGSGTGAVLWAMAAANAQRILDGAERRELHYVAVESSSPMIDTSEELAKSLFDHDTFRNCVASRKFIMGNWSDAPRLLQSASHRVIAVAAYIIDESDRKHADEIATLLAASTRSVGADLLLVCAPYSKRDAVQAIANNREWHELPITVTASPWNGPIDVLGTLRSHVYTNIVGPDRLADKPSWNGHDNTKFASFEVVSSDLFQAEQRSPLILDQIQDAASKPDQRMTAIIGSAGSGKSHVLVERVARSVLTRRRDQGPVHALVTSFNKKMVKVLGEWLRERMDADPASHWAYTSAGQSCLLVNEETGSSITVTNWDKLLYDYLALPYRVITPITDRTIEMRLAAKQIKFDAMTEANQRLIQSDFIEAELQRVIYGLSVRHDLDEYKIVDRIGRRRPLNPNQRELVWKVSMELPLDAWFTWPHRRMEALTASESLTAPICDLLFIDECQDMAPADFEIARRLVPDPNALTIAGDETQSLHLGASYRRVAQLALPYDNGAGPNFRLWLRHDLGGSYRLPLRVCEAIRPLAELIASDRNRTVDTHDVVVPDPKRGAVLGVRPIIVSAENAIESISQILRSNFRLLDSVAGANRWLTVADGQFDITKASSFLPPNYSTERATMLSIKGLERACIVWPSASELTADESAAEWVYTILTRTCALCIIIVDRQGTRGSAAKALRALRPDRLLFWDQEAFTAFETCCEMLQRGVSA